MTRDWEAYKKRMTKRNIDLPKKVDKNIPENEELRSLYFDYKWARSELISHLKHLGRIIEKDIPNSELIKVIEEINSEEKRPDYTPTPSDKKLHELLFSYTAKKDKYDSQNPKSA